MAKKLLEKNYQFREDASSRFYEGFAQKKVSLKTLKEADKEPPEEIDADLHDLPTDPQMRKTLRKIAYSHGLKSNDAQALSDILMDIFYRNIELGKFRTGQMNFRLLNKIRDQLDTLISKMQ